MPKQPGSYPFWLIVCGWLTTIFFGSLVLTIGMQFVPMVAFPPVAGFRELSAYAALFSLPALLVFTLCTYLLTRSRWNRSLRNGCLYGLLLLVTPGTFLFLPYNHCGALIIEELGYLPMPLVYALTGTLVLTVSLWIVSRKSR